MGSPCLFTRQKGLKMGYIYWLRVKNSNHLHTELSLALLEEVNFYHESKASFIDISSIASLKLFFIAWLREYCTFSNSSVVSLKSSPWPKYIQLGSNSKKNSCSTIKLLLQICSSLDCSYQILEKNRGSPCLFKRKRGFISLSSLERNLLRFVRARAHVRALMTRKSCAVGDAQ